MEITFWIADPPAVSFYTFHCIKAPNSDSKDVDLRVNSDVVGAHGRFLLIRTLLAGDDQDEYFIYKGHPSPHPSKASRLFHIIIGCTEWSLESCPAVTMAIIS